LHQRASDHIDSARVLFWPPRAPKKICERDFAATGVSDHPKAIVFLGGSTKNARQNPVTMGKAVSNLTIAHGQHDVIVWPPTPSGGF
jgi:hypothetical protein